jgi:hypothetical protein
MKTLVLSAFIVAVFPLVESAHAQVGESRAQIEALLGNPSWEGMACNGHCTTCTYTHRNWNLVLSYNGTNCIAAMYEKMDGSAITTDELTQLLQRNSQGYEWIRQFQGQTQFITYLRSDHEYDASLVTPRILGVLSKHVKADSQTLSRRRHRLFDGTWIGTLTGHAGDVEFTLIISRSGTVERDTSRLPAGGPRHAANDGKTMVWQWGIDNKENVTFHPNPDGETALVTSEGPSIRGLSAYSAASIFRRAAY